MRLLQVEVARTSNRVHGLTQQLELMRHYVVEVQPHKLEKSTQSPRHLYLHLTAGRCISIKSQRNQAIQGVHRLFASVTAFTVRQMCSEPVTRQRSCEIAHGNLHRSETNQVDSFLQCLVNPATGTASLRGDDNNNNNNNNNTS